MEGVTTPIWLRLPIMEFLPTFGTNSCGSAAHRNRACGSPRPSERRHHFVEALLGRRVGVLFLHVVGEHGAALLEDDDLLAPLGPDHLGAIDAARILDPHLA